MHINITDKRHGRVGNRTRLVCCTANITDKRHGTINKNITNIDKLRKHKKNWQIVCKYHSKVIRPKSNASLWLASRIPRRREQQLRPPPCRLIWCPLRGIQAVPRSTTELAGDTYVVISACSGVDTCPFVP